MKERSARALREGEPVPLSWNDTARAYEDTATLVDLVARAVRRKPDAVALRTSDGAETTYAELWARAGVVTNALVAEGVGRGDHVAVLIEHSPSAIIAILGVVASGAAYVPLDQRWPAARLAEPLAQLSVRWVLTSPRQARLAEEATWLGAPEARVVLIDPDREPVDPAYEQLARDLWDDVASAADPLRAAGFNQGAHAETFTSAQVGVYVEHVAGLAAADRPKSVLEIGCGTGLVAGALAPRITDYVGIDPSPVAAQRCRAALSAHDITATVHTGFAHDDLDRLLGDQRFDVVLLSSVVQFFPSPEYARQVLGAALARLAPGGALVVADVIDYADPPQGDHLRLPRSWFAAFIEGLDVPVDLEVVERGGEQWPGTLGRRYDVVLRPQRSSPAGSVRPGTLDWEHRVDPDQVPVPRPAEPDSSAYVIFTSGSSGRPKGVEVHHRSAVNLVEWVNRTYRVSAADCLLLVTAFTFDLSVYDIFGLLAANGTIRLLGPDELADPDRIADVLDHEPITFWDSAPAALSQVMSVAAHRGAPVNTALRLVFLSGDWVPLPLPAQLRHRFGAGVEVVALGGATEATVWSNYFDVGEVDPGWPSIPYGRPIQNARYYVLDADRAPCAIGEAGDLFIAGVPVAAGYAADAELTAERFSPDPFVAGDGERMYATGDRARWLPEGIMQFLGRTDDQVKVRGYRIELGDVQASLRRVEAVSDAVALLVDGPGGKELVGAVTGGAGAPLTPAAVRARLGELLPAYMVPDHILVLPGLPVGPTGKVDRDAVAEVVLERRREWKSSARGVPGGGALAERVLGLVRDVLERDVAADESFLDAGGHSLAAAYLRARVQEELGTTVRVSDILGAPTIGELITLVSTGAAATTPGSPSRASDVHPVSRAQARALYELTNAPDVPAYQNQVSLRLPAHLTRDRVESALAAAIAVHPVLWTNFRAVTEGWVGVVGRPWRPTVEEVDLRVPGADPDQARQALRDALRAHGRVAWDLEAGRLADWKLLRVTDDELVLSQVEHHLVHDGWSLTLLLRSFLDALAGRPPRAEPRSYQEHVLAEAAESAALVDEPQFVERVDALAGSPADPVAPLPDLGRHRQETGAALADAVTVVVDGESYQVLEKWARQHRATPFELLMTAFLATLHQQTGQADLVIGSAVSARPPGFESTLGMFVNTVPVRTGWQDDFAGFLEVVSGSLRAAVDGELIPYDALLDGVRRREGSRRDSLYRCMFSAHNAKLPDMAVHGGGRAFLEYHQNGTAKTPLDVLVLPKQDDADSSAPEGSVRLVWEFDRSLYSVDLVQDMVDRFAGGLRALAAAVAAGDAEGWRWPAVAPVVVSGPPVRHRAGRGPRRSSVPAVVWPGGITDYGDFAHLVEAGKHALRTAGAREGDVVAVEVGRDAAYCARVSAALDCGVAVMPVATSGPADRLRAALSTAHLRWSVDGRVTRLGHADTLAVEPATAYVVHTSGSTGTPKRVSVTRDTMSAYTTAFIDALGLTSADVVAATSSPLFDASFEEVLPILAVGGTLLLTDLGDGIPGLLDQVARARATVIDLPTALWSVLADHLERHDERLPEHVRAVVIGGEAYEPARAARFARRHRGAVALLSTYGPSECGVSVAFHWIDGVEGGSEAPQLGKPVPGAVLCVVDETGAGVPRGRPGVLGIAGVPCGPAVPGVRAVSGVDGPVYLTGDLARVTHSGRIDFLGRADGELKIRGFRVAPEEVERSATLVDGISRAAAVDVPAPDGSVKLGLVVVGTGGGSGAELRARVRATMSALVPDYMLPEVVATADELPVNGHGKVDRAAVRALLAERAAAAPVAPDVDPTGGRVRALWSSALGPMAPHDVDFITAGGDSLSAMRLATAIEEQFAVRLRFRDVLRAESCSALDELVTTLS